MYRIRLNIFALVILVGIFLCSFSVSAKEIEVGADVGMEYTSNAARVSENEDDDLVVISRVSAKIDAGSGPFKFDADTSFRRENYTQDAFTDKDYFTLAATANWEQLRNVIDWTLEDYFSQQSIVSFGATTPDNVQDTNVVTFGPTISLQLSGRQLLTIRPEYQKFTYEVIGVDNQSNLLNVDWSYKIFRTMSVGLLGTLNKVDYDEPLISDIRFSNLGATFSGTTARASYNAVLGVTKATRAGDSDRGFSGSMTWIHNLTDYSNIRTYASSDLTNSSNRLLDIARNPGNGDFSSQQISSEVVRNRIVRVSYTKSRAAQVSSVWAEILDQNYERSLFDQEVQATGFDFNYSLTSATSMDFYARYERTDLTDINRQDKESSVGSNLNYSLSRRLRALFSLKYQERNSTLDIADYTEFSVFAGLVYGYGSGSR